MSTYYYYHKIDTNEYFDLSSGSWYPYYEDLLNVLEYAIVHNIGIQRFIEKLKKDKVFEDFYDDGSDYLDEDNIKYFIKPLYKWASGAKKNGVQSLGIELVSDYELYELAVWYLCQDKGIKYIRRGYAKDDSSNPIDQAEEKFKQIHSKTQWDETTRRWVENPGADGCDLVDYYLTKKGALNWGEVRFQDEGVGFERALTEMKHGAPVWRASDPDNIYQVVDGKIVSTYDKDGKPWCSEAEAECLLAEDWCF